MRGSARLERRACCRRRSRRRVVRATGRVPGEVASSARSGGRGREGTRAPARFASVTSGRPIALILAHDRERRRTKHRRAETTRAMRIDAYDAFQEGSRLLADENPHAAVVALERARDLEPDKGSVRETLGRAYFRTGRFAAGAGGVRAGGRASTGQRLRALRPRACTAARRRPHGPAATSSSRSRCGPTRTALPRRARASRRVTAVTRRRCVVLRPRRRGVARRRADPAAPPAPRTARRRPAGRVRVQQLEQPVGEVRPSSRPPGSRHRPTT